MSTTLRDRRVAATLDRMYAESREQMSQLRNMRDALSTSRTAQERADAMSAFYIPVTPEAGRLLYSLVRAARPATIVEFGMSFGISALHLASAVRDNGSGRVVTTELSAGGAPLTVANLPYSRRGERPDGSLWPEDQPERVKEWNTLLGGTIGHRTGVRILDLNKKLCPDGVYTASVDGIQVRSDGVHLTPEGVNWLMPWLEKSLR